MLVIAHSLKAPILEGTCNCFSALFFSQSILQNFSSELVFCRGSPTEPWSMCDSRGGTGKRGPHVNTQHRPLRHDRKPGQRPVCTLRHWTGGPAGTCRSSLGHWT